MRNVLIVASMLFGLPVFATEPNPSARQRELIVRLLEATKASTNMRAMTDAIFAQVEKSLLAQAAANGNDPERIAEAREVFGGFRERASKIDFGALMLEENVRMYAKYFTERELQDLLAFYGSPTGRKSIEVLPLLVNEGAQAGVKLVTPKIEEAMTEARAEFEKKRPWRQAMLDLRTVSTALEAWSIDHDDTYPAGDYAGLKQILSPEYIRTFPEKDTWGHPYAYVVSEDRKHFRLVSAGADTNFEWDSLRIAPIKTGEDATRYSERLEDDLIIAEGSFVQLPKQAKNER